MANQSVAELLRRVEERVCPVLEANAAAVDAEGSWPQESLRALGEAGLLGLPLPAAAGGGGNGMREFTAVTERIAGSCASTAMIYLMHVCAAQVIATSQAACKEDAVERMASGRALATLAFSERGSRSHFWAPVSRARRNGDATVLDCEKSFVTSAGQADFYVVSAGSIDGKTPLDSSLYLISKETKGL